ncbi:MAG: hypothetical protein LZF62_340019 [Nitrospira sp.]|nr:MAG: hypothetical protein LZF62_340019 [Nitrospira sp.]
MNPTPIETTHEQIETILAKWARVIGEDYLGYKGHVYRMFNFCLALHPCTEEEKTKLSIAACFHDIGLWSNHTLDYIPPSLSNAALYLSDSGRQEWSEEIALMIDMHHKVRAYTDRRYPLVEVFRKSDLIDVSLGLFSCGIARSYITGVKKHFPNHGFHRFLLETGGSWLLKHPFDPAPFMRW